MRASRGRCVRLVLRALACVAALGCGEGQDPGVGPGPEPEARPELPALILSDPSVPRASGTAGSRAALVDAVVYASLPPGSLPDAPLALFTNLTTGAGTTAIVVDGGFDPVPIPAVAGDSLRIRIQAAGAIGERLFYAKVAPQRAPRVVRSSPSPGRSDVPLNTRIYVVFSEPMSAAALSDSAVYLSVDSIRVAGTLAFADSSRLSVTFSPAEPLAAGTRYSLRVASAARDAGGDAVGAPVVIPFSTPKSAVSPPDSTPPPPGSTPSPPDSVTPPPPVGQGTLRFTITATGPDAPSSVTLSAAQFDCMAFGEPCETHFMAPNAQATDVRHWTG
ncbi:MAG: Ig-like domain-containing protein, partial [Gemmatimonadales bacterium]